MVDVKRGNVILTVDDEEADKYFEKGYSILDSFGNIAKASVPSEKGTLQKAYVEMQEQLKMKDAEIASLKGQVEMLLAEMSKPKTTQQPKKTVNKSTSDKEE